MKKSPTIAFFETTADDRSYYTAQMKNMGDLYFTNLAIQDDIEVDLGQVEILSIHVASDVNSEIIKRMPRLKLIATRATGFNNIDCTTAKHHAITICNVPGYGSNVVAEYAFMLLLALCRKLIPGLNQMKSGNINHVTLTGTDLHGKTIGIIGTGSIGSHVGRIANGFGMKVLAFDPYPNHTLEYDLNLSYVSLAQLCEDSDIITLHAPYTKENHHIIDSRMLGKMKKGAYLINTARGELIDSKALVAVLASGKLAGAALDVFEGESIFKIDEEIELLSGPRNRNYDYALENLVLEKMPNVILSPHNAFNSKEAIRLVQNITLDNIKKYLDNGPQNVVAI